MQHKFLIIVLTLMLVPIISSAEFYKFRDESGVLHYTDDLFAVPKEQRPKVEAYSGADDFLVPELKQEKTGDQTRIELSKAKAALDEEYKELMKTKQALDTRTESMKIAEDAKIHNEKVVQLNERIVDYEKRRQTIRNKIDAFNAPKLASTDTD